MFGDVNRKAWFVDDEFDENGEPNYVELVGSRGLDARVAVAMKHDFGLCPHCFKPVGVRLSSDIGVIFRVVDDYLEIVFVLFVPEALESTRKLVLYRRVYARPTKREGCNQYPKNSHLGQIG